MVWLKGWKDKDNTTLRQTLCFEFVKREVCVYEIIAGVTGQRHSATSLVISSYLMFSKKALGKTLKIRISHECLFLKLCCRIMLI